MLPLHREGLTSYLSPLLGQYGIKNIEFVTNFVAAFNEKTQSMYSGDIMVDDLELGLSDEVLFIPIALTVYKNGKYIIETGYPSVGSIYQTTSKKKRRFYRYKNFYRNYKKLLQLTSFTMYVNIAMQNELKFLYGQNAFNSSAFRLTYAEVRNSLHRKD